MQSISCTFQVSVADGGSATLILWVDGTLIVNSTLISGTIATGSFTQVPISIE